MTIDFTLTLSETLALPGIDYHLTGEVEDGVLDFATLQCMRLVIWHGPYAEEFMPVDDQAIRAKLYRHHRDYVLRKARQAWELECARLERDEADEAVTADGWRGKAR